MHSVLRFLSQNILVRYLIYFYVRLLFWSYRLAVQDIAGEALPLNKSRGLYYFWHENVLLGLCFLHKQGVHGHVVTDESSGGELIAFIARKLGFRVVYGSKKISFARTALDVLDLNGRLYMIGDYHGESRVVQKELPYLSARTNVPLIHLSCNASSSLRAITQLNGLRIPLPFSWIRVKIHMPRFFKFDEENAVVERARE